MGAAQSAQRQDKKDAAAAAAAAEAEEEEESGKVDDAPTQRDIDDKPLKNNGQISEINGKADGPIAEVNGQCEDEIAAEVVLSPSEDVSETEKPHKEEERPLKNVENNEKISMTEDAPLEMIEMNAKQTDINEGFRRFFRSIGFKFTVKRGSTEKATHVPDETNKEEPNKTEDVNDTRSKEAEMNTDVNKAPESYDNDSTTCPTLTDVTSEDVLENAKKETEKNREEAESNNAEAATGGEDAHQDASSKWEQLSTSSSSPEEVVVSPVKRFFTTGIFSGLRKKNKPADDETTEKELMDMGKKEVAETTEQTVQNQQQDKKETSPGVNTAAAEAEHKENKLKEEILSAPSAQTSDEGKSSSTDPSAITVTETHILSSQEKDKVQESPLKRLLLGSSFKKLPKKQRSRKSSDAKLSDSGEHVSDQLLSSTESAENQKEESPPQPSAEEAGEDDGAWASFIKLLTPKKRMKRSSLSNEETQIPGSVEEQKPSEGEQISDQSTEEGRKRKDSSVSWEAVLCGSGRRRSRKTSDSEDETPDKNDHKPDDGPKNVAELPKHSSNENENEILASSPKQAGSPLEGDGTLTWKSLKKLLTPKGRAKDEDESKENIHSDSEVTQDESSFSIKRLLPGRKKQKSAEKQDQVSSDEADKDVASDDEDSETPAVIPLSEFDTVETEVNIQTQADIESHIPEEANNQLQQELLDQVAEPVQPCDSLNTEAKKVQDNNSSEKQVSATSAENEGHDDLTESVSKHQQLSDIPEEGIITETMATPASVTGEAARDDTIAEDLIEITSEAITAPEPASDITLADETEMVSAVSQLSSESSKTSGNTTPVPVENDIIDTDRLLHQVVETISISPMAVPVCSDELSSEKIIGFVSHQTSETHVKEPAIPKIHKRLDATAINAGLNVDELAFTSQTESISEVNDSVSTEIASEVPTEEFDTAEMAPDEIRNNVTNPEESLKELDSINGSHPLMECLFEMNASVSTDILHEGEEIVSEEGSLVDAHQVATEPPKTSFQVTDSAAAVADEIKDEAMEQQVKAETEKEDLLIYNVTDQIEAEDKSQAPAEVEKLQELAAVQAATFDSQEGNVQLLEENVKSEAETLELKEEILPLTEVCVEPEKEIKTDVAKTDCGQVPEASEAVPSPTIDSERSSVQVPEEDIKSEDILPAETVSEEPKQTAGYLTDVRFEPEDKELPVNAVRIEDNQVPEVIEAVLATTVDSEEGSVQSTEERGKAKDTPSRQPLKDELKQTREHLTEVSFEPEDKKLEVNAVKTEHFQELKVIEAVPSPTIDSERSSVQVPEEDIKSEDISSAETVTEEPQKTAEHLTEVYFEPEDKKLEVNAVKTEHFQELKVIEAVPSPTIDSERSSVQVPEEDIKSEDISSAETVTEEPQKTAEHLTEVYFEPEDKKLEVNAVKTEHFQELKVIEAVPSPTIDSERSSVQVPEEDIKSEDISSAETVTEEPPKTAEHLTEVYFDPKDKELAENAVKTEHVQELEVLEAVPALTVEEGSVQSTEEKVKSEDILPAETVSEDPKMTAEHLTEVYFEPKDKELAENAVKTEHVQELEVLEAVPALTVEEGSVQSTEEKVKSKDIPPGQPLEDELKRATKHLTEVSVKPENKELQVNAAKTEHVQELIVTEAIPAPTIESEKSTVQMPEEDVKSGDISSAETVTEETKKIAEHIIDVSFEPEDKELPGNDVKIEQNQIPEVMEDVPAPTVDSERSSVQMPEEDVKSGDISSAETVTEETKKIAEHVIDVSFEPEDKELPENAVKIEQNQIPEVMEAVPAPTVDSGKSTVQVPVEDVKSEDILSAETVSEEPKNTEEHLADVRVKPEDKELPVNAVKIEHNQVPEVIEAVPAPTVDSEEGSVQSTEEEVKSKDIPPGEPLKDELKQTTEHLTEVSVKPENTELQVKAFKTEHVQDLEVIEAIPAPTIDSEKSTVQMPEEDVKSEDILSAETVSEEPQNTEEHFIDVRFEPEDQELPVSATKIEHYQVPEVKEALQEHILDSEEGNVQSLKEKVKLEDLPAAETVTDELKEEILPLTEVCVEPEKEAKLEADAAKTEHFQIKEASQAIPASTIDSERSSVQVPEEDIKSEDISPVQTGTEEPQKTAEHLTEVYFEPKDKELAENAVKTEHVQELEVLEAISGPRADSQKSSIQMPEEDVKLEDILSAETFSEDPKMKTEHPTEVSVKPEDVELAENAVKSEHNQVPEVIEAVPAPTVDSEEGSVQSLKKEVILEDIPKAETVTDEHTEDTICLTDVNLEPVDASKPEPVQEPKELQAVQAAAFDLDVGNLPTLEKKVKSEDTPVVEIVRAKPKQENDLRVEIDEKQMVEAAQTEPVQEPEILQSDVKDILTETQSKEDALINVPLVTEGIERCVTQELEKKISLENIPKPDTSSVIASVKDKTEIEVLAQLGEALQITLDQETESIPQEFWIEQRDCFPEAVNELQTLTELHVSSVYEEASNVQVLGKTVVSEETSVLCVENAAAIDELKHEVNHSAVQINGELEKKSELPGTEIKTAAVEHAIVAQIVVCNLKDVSDPLPDILIEKTSETSEPLIETMASELVLKEESEAAAPLVTDNIIETAEEGSVVVLMHVPSVTFEDNPRTHVRVVSDTKSAETTVDSVLEVGIIETKEVLDVCQETVEKVADITLTPEEEDLIIEENKITIREVTQHVLENLPETVPESLVVSLEKEVIKEPDETTKVSQMAESESNYVEDQKVIDVSIGLCRDRQDEATSLISDDSATDRQLTEDPIQTCDIPGGLDVSINDHKEDLQETEADQEKSEEGVTAEEVKSLSKELDEKKNHEQAQVTQIAQSPIGTPSNTGSLIPQNTGIISSLGNVEPPSSLSLEFKLQFGQTKVPVPPPQETERTAPMKLTEDVSEFRLQVVDAESQINPELTKAAVQSTEIAEPAATTSIIATQPVLLDVGIQAETVEPEELIKSTDTVIPSVQSTESIEPIQSTEKRVFLSQPVPVLVQETKSQMPEQIERENDQDVWMDAKEVIYTLEETKVSVLKVEEPVEPQTESEEQQKAGPGHGAEMAPESKTEEEESQQKMQKKGGICETDSEGEEFAGAVEQLATATISITTD